MAHAGHGLWVQMISAYDGPFFLKLLSRLSSCGHWPFTPNEGSCCGQCHCSVASSLV